MRTCGGARLHPPWRCAENAARTAACPCDGSCWARMGQRPGEPMSEGCRDAQRVGRRSDAARSTLCATRRALRRRWTLPPPRASCPTTPPRARPRRSAYCRTRAPAVMVQSTDAQTADAVHRGPSSTTDSASPASTARLKERFSVAWVPSPREPERKSHIPGSDHARALMQRWNPDAHGRRGGWPASGKP